MTQQVLNNGESGLTIREKINGNFAELFGGTSFPGTPGLNDRYYRTDRNIEYFWNGTRWLSTQLFSVDMPAIPAGIGATTLYYALPAFLNQYDLWLETLEATVFRAAAGEWDVVLSKRTSADVPTTLVTLDGSVDATGVYINKTAAINDLMQVSAHKMLGISYTEISGTAGFLGLASVTYRLVG